MKTASVDEREYHSTARNPMHGLHCAWVRGHRAFGGGREATGAVAEFISKSGEKHVFSFFREKKGSYVSRESSER